jgi:hypothetical protein
MQITPAQARNQEKATKGRDDDVADRREEQQGAGGYRDCFIPHKPRVALGGYIPG